MSAFHVLCWEGVTVLKVISGAGFGPTRFKYLVEVALLHSVYCLRNSFGLAFLIWLDSSSTWCVPMEIGMVRRSACKGTFGSVVL